MAEHLNSFSSRADLVVGDRAYTIFRLDAVERAGHPGVARLPYSLKILLENLLRGEDGRSVTRDDIAALADWSPATPAEREIAYRPARVLLQDFTGVPCVVDLAAMRDAMADLGGDPERINPLQPVELVIDHSVQVDRFGEASAFGENAALEFDRNRERYAFLKWGQSSLAGFRAVPPDTGIVHQVNIEFLGRVVFGAGGAGEAAPEGTQLAYPDTVVGTDSHTTMANGLGILAWGVGGIEAEAAMLGQPVTMLVPDVLGVRLAGALKEGVTSTDLVLAVTERLRKTGVVGKFVEFYGRGLSNLSVSDRVTIGNMSPEYGSTVAIFPIDHHTLTYLKLTGRSAEQIDLVEQYARAQGMFRTDESLDPVYTETIEFDLSSVVPNLAGPSRPQDRVALSDVKASFAAALEKWQSARTVPVPQPPSGAGRDVTPASNHVGDVVTSAEPATATQTVEPPVVGRFETEGGGGTAVAANVALVEDAPASGAAHEVSDGAVVIAAITSCTNTSNPSVLIGAGLVAKKAVERGLTRKPWVKTSLAPGSKVVTDYLEKAGLQTYLDRVGFSLVGYGCTTCIGNSGPLPDDVAEAVSHGDLIVAAVLSGNRNFEGRIHPQVRANYLASPPLVVAYALAGRMDVDLATESLGTDREGKPVFLSELWPTNAEIDATIKSSLTEEMFTARYGDVFAGDENWAAMQIPAGERYAWDPSSEYVKKPPYFTGMQMEPVAPGDIAGARALAVLGDSVTTDHISPAGNIAKSSPAAAYLNANGVANVDFNSYGARRGNHEVMVRGTFANTRLRNALVPGVEGGVTRYLPTGERMSIYDASEKYRADGTPLIVIAGKEYGTGSSRDWAAKGTMLLGVRAVIAESFERIHRSNLVGMGILPLEFGSGQSRESLGLTGEEVFAIEGLEERITPRSMLEIAATPAGGGAAKRFTARVRIDTPDEAEYYRHGGILHYVLRSIAKG